MDTRVHYDEEQAARLVTKRLSLMLEKIDQPGVKGAEARFNVAIFRPFMMALVAENNRGASLAEIERALASALANVMVTWSSTASDSDDPDVIIPHFNSLAVMIDDFATTALQKIGRDPEAHLTDIHAQQAGRA